MRPGLRSETMPTAETTRAGEIIYEDRDLGEREE
jgi:hypothetical protein